MANQAQWINLNGNIILRKDACLPIDNRSFRYADGCFETMRFSNDQIVLAPLHLNRLFATLDALQYTLPVHFTPAFVHQSIAELVKKNNQFSARIRFTISRGNGGLYEGNNELQYLIESFPIPHSVIWNERGLQLDFFSSAIKPADRYSQYKTSNFFCYAMAAQYARSRQLDDMILLNQYGRLADTTIANIFIIQNGIIKTPGLTDGCVGGVMRQYLLESFKKEDYPVIQCEISVEDVLQAQEVFVTNAIKGMQWVERVGESRYNNQLSRQLFQKFIHPLFNY